jgi:hypothetical protein
MVLEAGVDLKLHTFFLDTIVEKDRITNLITAAKSGLEAQRSLML